MGLNNLKILIWCGHAANQKALANKIATLYTVEGVVIEAGDGKKKKRKLIKWPAFFLDRIRFQKIYSAWKNLMKYYDNKFPGWPNVPMIKVTGINCKETTEFTQNIQPDLIIVSGTALIKEPLLSIPARIGIINLHTGLSPFVKGGPNCTNWCIANNTWDLIGNTIMWLNAGIDSGNIIMAEKIDIKTAPDLTIAHQMVMEHAHELYSRAIGYLSGAVPPYLSVSQESIGKGKLFLTKMWTAAKRKDLLRNWDDRNSFVDNTTAQTVSVKEGKS